MVNDLLGKSPSGSALCNGSERGCTWDDGSLLDRGEATF
uniref:Uncharacterized protein n=1 Tax=Setaria italica TaxID=4555 RepID=K4A3U3_SETIT